MQTTLHGYRERGRKTRKAWSVNACAKRRRNIAERHAESVARLEAEADADNRRWAEEGSV